jgi:hypothetical protein
MANTNKIDLQELGWGMDWIDLAYDEERWQDTVKAVMNRNIS